MKVDIRFRGLEASDFLRDHALRRAQFHMSRFGTEVSSVVVRIADINGPKGGIDKRCQVTVKGPLFGSTNLDEESADAYAVVDGALERVSRVVGKAIERARSAARDVKPAAAEEES